MPTGESTKVFRGLSQQTLITVLYAVVQLTYFSLMSRLLDKEVFGYFAIVTAVSYVLIEISQAGLGSAVIQNKNASKDFIVTAYSLSLFLGGIFAILLASLSGFLSRCLIDSNILVTPFWIMSGALFFSTVSSVPIALYMKNLEFIQYGIIQISSSIVSSTAGVLLAYFGWGVYSLAWALFLYFFMLATLTFIKKKKELAVSIHYDNVNYMLTYGGWLTASGIIRSLYEQMDRLITSRWISASLLGMYTRASGFVIHISSNVNSIFDTILFPIISGIQDDPEKLKNSYLKSTELIFLMSFVFSFSMILLAEPIIYIFLGEKWLDTATIFKIVAVSLLFHPFGRIGDSFFRSIGIVKQYFGVRVAICVSSVVLISLGSITSGIIGLACAYLASRIIDAVLKMIILNKRIGVTFSIISKRIINNFLLIGIVFAISYIINLQNSHLLWHFVGFVFFAIVLIIIALACPVYLGSAYKDYVFVRINSIVYRLKKT